jgi:hypothetical protein
VEALAHRDAGAPSLPPPSASDSARAGMPARVLLAPRVSASPIPVRFTRVLGLSDAPQPLGGEARLLLPRGPAAMDA